MKVRLLTNDGRCKWLQTRMLNQLFPEMIESSKNDTEKTKYMIKDWVSNDNGRVGADLKWMAEIGVPLVENYKDITENDVVVNTGYDSIYDEEIDLRRRGIEFIDAPCPFVRKVRNEFEDIKTGYQYVLLCEPNHIIIKNYKALFPADMILVQMHNYEERIREQQNGKPLYLVPYVTFLPKQSKQIYDFIQQQYPDRENKYVNLSCMWVNSKVSPIVEMNALTAQDLEGIEDALIITTAKSTNKSLVSLTITAEDMGLNVIAIGSLEEFLSYEAQHQNSRILLVRSPIPNMAEEPIMKYIEENRLVDEI